MLKKLIFAPFFLIFITTTLFFYQKILAQYLNVFFGNYGGLYEFTLLAAPLLFASLAYCLFITFTQDFKYALILAVLTAFIPFAFLDFNLSIIIGVGLLMSLITSYFNLQINLKNYINFQPTTLLNSPTRMLNTFLLLTLSAGFYLNANMIIQKEGFKIPDSLIDWAVNLSTSSQMYNFKGDKRYLAQVLTQEQIELLKQNPQLLKQYGVKPEDLDSLNTLPTSSKTSAPAPQVKQTEQDSPKNESLSLPSGNLKDVLKKQIGGMVDQALKPYLFAIPILLAFMFYSLASLILWVLSFLIVPLLSALFYIFEKSGFVKYEKEMREVKKIVI